jgi:hypothetical protein
MKLEIGQRLWDEKNCRVIEIVKDITAAYYCKTIDADGTEGYQWFKAVELNGLKPAR